MTIQYQDPGDGGGGGGTSGGTGQTRYNYAATASAVISSCTFTSTGSSSAGYLLTNTADLVDGDQFLISKGTTYGGNLATLAVDKTTHAVTVTFKPTVYIPSPPAKPTANFKVLSGNTDGSQQWVNASNVVGFYWESALTLADKQPIWVAPSAAVISNIKYYRDNTTYPTVNGTIQIKKNGSIIYNITIATYDPHQSLVTQPSFYPTTLLASDVITATVITTGTGCANINVILFIDRTA